LEAGNILDEVEEIEGVHLLVKQVNVSDMNRLRQMADSLKEKLDSGILVLASVNNEKVNIVTSVSEDLVKAGHHAGKIVKEVATI
ncbi:DHHA1 domain-containing protein, partial [Pseudomonas sp. 2822-17]|uniref:DHHA1 domain-containing protein n=1 Tax=Pseudomonas sp. 2822-17 TaxID=1712678 RepID=UPI00117B2141